MKKHLLPFVCILCLLLVGCGQKTAPVSAKEAASQESSIPTATAPVSTANTSVTETDLTSMSSTMVYSYVYNMVNTPESFVGQRFRIRGTYDEQLWDVTGLTYHYIVIADATSCCAQGLEFVLTDENAAYPQVGEEFEISGIFGTYIENGTLYIQITADQYRRI